MKREPLYPHVLRRREPLFPHRSKAQLPQTYEQYHLGDFIYDILMPKKRGKIIEVRKNVYVIDAEHMGKAMIDFRDARRISEEFIPISEKFITISFQGDTTFKPGEIVSEQAFKAENKRVTKLGLRPARGWVTSKGELRVWRNGWRPVEELEEYLPATERAELLVRYTGGPQRFGLPVGLEGKVRNFAGWDWVILDTPRNRQIIRETRRWTIARQQPAHLRRKPPSLLPATAKEPWQMTREEWLVDVGYKKSQGSRVRENWLGTHEGEVRVAIQNRKPVPPEVLKDYPDMKPPQTSRLPPRTAA